MLLQFYDPQLHCFTFQDYQLAPTLEEYAYILYIKITDNIPFAQVPEIPNYLAIAKALYLTVSEVEVNWNKKCDMQGISRVSDNKAKGFAEEGKWTALNALLAVLIYGLVLLPVAERLVDLAAICVFMNDNPISTL